jgi:signal transduction histidine kinase
VSPTIRLTDTSPDILHKYSFSFFCIFNLLVAWLNTTGLKVRSNGFLFFAELILIDVLMKHVVAHASFILPVVSSVIFGSRLILNLRESYYESYDQEFSIRVVTSMDPEDDRISLDLPTAISDLHLATRPTLEP